MRNFAQTEKERNIADREGNDHIAEKNIKLTVNQFDLDKGEEDLLHDVNDGFVRMAQNVTELVEQYKKIGEFAKKMERVFVKRSHK